MSSVEETQLKETVSQKHEVPLINGGFVVPDVRVQYEDPDGNEQKSCRRRCDNARHE